MKFKKWVHVIPNLLILSGLLFIMLTISSCSGPVVQKLSPDVIYKKDMTITIDDMTVEGVAVVPAKDVHKLHIVAQGDLDLFTFTTCHREEVAEDAGNVTERRGLFRRKIEKKREVKLEYRPTMIEKTGACPIQLGGYEEEKGRHSWGFIDFETPDAILPAKVFCNGQETASKGVSACQSRVGLIQAIEFQEEVYLAPTIGCEIGYTKGTFFKFPLRKGQCVYAFMNKKMEIHRLTTLGYEVVPIRK